MPRSPTSSITADARSHPATAHPHTQRTVRLVQISDIHLSAAANTHYRGIHVLPRLRRLMKSIAHWQPDVIVASGDLSQDKSSASYDHLQHALAPLRVPVVALPGNHDDPGQLDRPGWIPWHRTPLAVGRWQLLALNSRWGNRPDGLLSDHELNRLDDLAPEYPAIVFVHHHPVTVGTAWIDRFPLLNGRLLLQQLETRPRIRALAFGHIHHVWQGQIAPPLPGASRQPAGSPFTSGTSCSLWGCPAASINTQRGVRQFSDDNAGAAARWIQLHTDGSMDSGILSAHRADGGGITPYSSRGSTNHRIR